MDTVWPSIVPKVIVLAWFISALTLCSSPVLGATEILQGERGAVFALNGTAPATVQPPSNNSFQSSPVPLMNETGNSMIYAQDVGELYLKSPTEN